MTQNISNDAAQPQAAQQDARAPWTTPQVIVSDLSDARSSSVIPGADGSTSGYAYGS